VARQKLLWKHRKRSEADPIRVLPCGCKQWVYDGTIVRRCELHDKDVQRSMGQLEQANEEQGFESNVS